MLHVQDIDVRVTSFNGLIASTFSGFQERTHELYITHYKWKQGFVNEPLGLGKTVIYESK